MQSRPIPTAHSTPTISMAYATAMMKAGGVGSLQASALLAQLGIEENTARLDERQFSALYRSLVLALDDELIGLCSRPMPAGALKYTCLALLDAKTLTIAMHRWSCMYRVTASDLRLRLTSSDDAVRMTVERTPFGTRYEPFATDMVLKLAHGLASWLVGRELPLLRVDLQFPRPPFAHDYDVFFPGPVHFDQAEPSLLIDARFFRLPIRRTREQLDDFLQRAPESWLFTRQRVVPALSVRLRDHLTAVLPALVTATTAAEALAVSARTMHRRLTDEGTSFQRIKDEVRRDRAIHLLVKTESPLADIGEQLGFDSTASFYRAFRSWTGSTPGTFRKDELSAS